MLFRSWVDIVEAGALYGALKPEELEQRFENFREREVALGLRLLELLRLLFRHLSCLGERLPFHLPAHPSRI